MRQAWLILLTAQALTGRVHGAATTFEGNIVLGRPTSRSIKTSVSSGMTS
jgi:hypothetical protein